MLGHSVLNQVTCSCSYKVLVELMEKAGHWDLVDWQRRDQNDEDSLFFVFQKKAMPIEVEAGKTYYWCTCGKSGKQPFCDGSHKGSTFAPMRFVAEEDGVQNLCGCKASDGMPFCDGSHKGTGFAPHKTVLTETKTVAWCGCKHTKGAPFCDGSHKTL